MMDGNPERTGGTKSRREERRPQEEPDGDNRTGQVKISKRDPRMGDLGEGVSGLVALHRSRKSGQLYVVKTYLGRERQEGRKEFVLRSKHEWDILSSLRHENIVRAYKWDVTTIHSRPRLSMEYVDVDVWKLYNARSMVALGTGPTLGLWRQVCSGVAFLHGRNVCHRDLKLDNLVVDSNSGVVKIIDFATALANAPPDGAMGLVGSKSYAAPETFSQISYDGKKADIWSLGIILHYLLNRKFPWKVAHRSDLVFAQFAAEIAGETDFSSTGKSGDSAFSSSLRRDTPVFFSNFPKQSTAVMKSIFQVKSPHRATMNDILTDEWYSSLQKYDSTLLMKSIAQSGVVPRS